MALFLLGAAGKLLGGAATKGAAKKAIVGKGKDVVKDKAKGKITKISKDKLLGKKSNAIVKSPAGALVPTPSAPIATPSPGGSSLLSEVIEIKVTTIKIKDLLASNLAQQKAADAAARKQAEKDAKAQREAELESKEDSGGEGIKLPGAPKTGIFDAIKRFLLFTFLGSLLGVIMKHHKPILKAFTEITDNLQNCWKLLKYAIAYLTTSGKGILKGLFKTFKFFYKIAKSTGKFLFDVGKRAFNALKSVAGALFDFLKPIVSGAINAAKELAQNLVKSAANLGKQFLKRANQLRKFISRAGRAAFGAIKGRQGAKGAVKAVKTAAQRSARQAGKSATKKVTKEATELVVKETTDIVAKETTDIVAKETTDIVVKETAEAAAKKASKEAAETAATSTAASIIKKAKGFSKIFKRIPVVGALIGIGIDMALGEKLDRAIVGSIGSSIGAGIGGILGQIAIPIPFFGAAAGGIIGGAIGEYLGKELYEMFRVAMGMGRSDESDKPDESDTVEQKSKGGPMGKPKKLPGAEVAIVPLENGETYYGIRTKQDLLTSLFMPFSGMKNMFKSKFKSKTGGSGSAETDSDAVPSGGGGGFNESSLKAAMDKAGYTDKTERAMFLAQMAHETGNFKYAEEIHDGSNYEGSKMLGNTEPGDGKRFKGRGYIQITGRWNYGHYGKKVGVDLIKNPELAADPKVAADVAIAYWEERVDRAAAKRGDVKKVTYGVNGGYNGLADREAKFKKYMGDSNYTAPGGNLIASAPPSSGDLSAPTQSESVGAPQPGDGRSKVKSKEEESESSSDSFGAALSKAMNNPSLIGDFGPSGGSASFGGGSVKKYDVEKSASYDDPSSSPIVVPIPPPAQSPPPAPKSSGGGKRNQVTPSLSLNSDINQLVSQAVFY